MAIAVLVLWIATAAAGVTLLRSGRTQRAGAADESPAEEVAASTGVLVRIGAVPLTKEGKPPPGPHVRVPTPPGEHPLLEFSHPALAITGVACWLMFTFVHYQPFAWISFAILVAALLLGVGWYLRNREAAQRRLNGSWTFSPRLLALHGAAAALSITLTVVTALVASHA
ncbi:MAG TPA: hypothetical protein VEH05_08615 [Streptosporangiaceae bacterium]|nr:hypothetical protein [Streptosporangiaceae bacterium]